MAVARMMIACPGRTPESCTLLVRDTVLAPVLVDTLSALSTAPSTTTLVTSA
jgi:hypothetical protein